MLDKPYEHTFRKKPMLMYIQHENHGIGELYLNGKRIYGLQEIEILAQTATDACFPKLKLKIIPEELAKFGTLEE